MPFLDAEYPYFEHLRERSPVHRLRESPFYLVSSWELIAEAVGRPADFSSNLTATMVWHEDGTVTAFPIAEPGSPLHVLATADDPIHREHRRMVLPSLVASRVRALTPFIETTFRRSWERGLADGRVDWVRAVAERVPMLVVAELLGLPAHDVDDLVRWAFASTALLDGVVTAEQSVEATEAVGELAAHLTAAFTAATAEPGANLLGDLARVVADGDVDHDTAVMILIQLVAAGAESTISLLGASVWLLARHPDVLARLRADRGLIPAFVEEALRLESPFRGHFRHVVRDTSLGEVDLPAGAHLYLAWGAANRDPRRFDAPDRIDLRPSARRSHMAFGRGAHLCVGAALARLETRIGIEFLLDATVAGFTADTANPQWVPSLLSRRLRTLPLTLVPR
ncbi:cytochrome P450 [Nocardia takedensis]|uniref:cytochrome P450 n=1 Tax=Nocardia takedensis TaxID=259390 RepID=UPI000593A440|nr:cytochrome P450 [Nocardia takedensis]